MGEFQLLKTNGTSVSLRADLLPRGVVAAAAFAYVFFSGCATSGGEPNNLQQCTEPRAPICTREYRPVCAQRKDGSWHTYGNACDACADANVSRHRTGACRP